MTENAPTKQGRSKRIHGLGCPCELPKVPRPRIDAIDTALLLSLLIYMPAFVAGSVLFAHVQPLLGLAAGLLALWFPFWCVIRLDKLLSETCSGRDPYKDRDLHWSLHAGLRMPWPWVMFPLDPREK
jgi:hypothetical protein